MHKPEPQIPDFNDESLIDSSKEEAIKRKPGRPVGSTAGNGKISKYHLLTTAQLALIEDCARKFFTDVEIALKLGCTRETFNRHKNKKGKVREAYLKGKALGAMWLKELAIKAANQGDTTAIFKLVDKWLKDDTEWAMPKAGPSTVKNNTLLINAAGSHDPKIAQMARNLVQSFKSEVTVPEPRKVLGEAIEPDK